MTIVKMFSSKVSVGAGETLGGSDPSRVSHDGSDALEVNGIIFRASDGREYCLCSLDALYAGELVDWAKGRDMTFIFAASHTHYAPMLDGGKPHIGQFSHGGFASFVDALEGADIQETSPTRCRLYIGEVDVPVYRRFDFPDNLWNRFLTRYFGFYPNDSKSIDRSIYLLEFGNYDEVHFVIVYHACHPVTLGVTSELSSDFVGVVREAVRQRFAVNTVLFLQGCAGDIRPNLALKRTQWLPKFRLNWKFNWRPPIGIVAQAHGNYRNAVLDATKRGEFLLNQLPFDAKVQVMCLGSGQEFDVYRIGLSSFIEFFLLPFEVSHLYHLGIHSPEYLKLIVSCVNKTFGYLSHPSQYPAGGYEVDGSLYFMGLSEKLEIRDFVP